MTPVTDPALLAQLNGSATGLTPVTDPALLAQLNTGDEPVTATGLAKSAGTGLVRGVEYLAGLPGDVGRGMSWLNDKLTGPLPPAAQAKLAATLPFSSSDIINAETKLTGGLHTAGNRAERAVENVTSFIPGAIGGPEAILANVLKRGVLPGAVSEGAGQLTEGTAAEPYARIAGALVSKGPKAAPLLKGEDAIAAGSRGFDTFRDLPFAVKGQTMSDWAKGLKGDLARRNFDAETTPGTIDVLDRLIGNTNPVTAREMDKTRMLLRNAQKAGGDDATAASSAIASLHDRINSFDTQHVVQGDPLLAQQVWTEANKNYSAGMAAKMFEDTADKALNKSATENSGLNSGNKLKSAYATILNNEKKTRGLTDAEVSQLQKLVNGTFAQNTIRSISNRLGGGGGPMGTITGLALGGLGGLGAGSEAGHPLDGSAIGAMLLANLARRTYNKSVTNQAQRLSQAVLSRAPIAQTMSHIPVAPHVPNSVQRILAISHALQVAHSGS